MSAQWVTSAAELPHDGQPVEFVLDGREVAMVGIYGQQIFRSRWSGYEVQRVRTWRSADSGRDRSGHEEPEYFGSSR